MAQPAVPGESASISVTDFGPIARAEFDLRPLTILAGPSNTGKSYSATLVHAILKCVSRSCVGGLVDPSGHPDPKDPMLPLMMADVGRELWQDVPRDERDRFIGWLRKSRNGASKGPGEGGALPGPIQDIMRNACGRSLGSGEQIGRLLTQGFGIRDARALVRRKSRKPARVRVSFSGESVADLAGLEFSPGPSGVSARGSISPGFGIRPAAPHLAAHVLHPLGWGRGRCAEAVTEESAWHALGAMLHMVRLPRLGLVSPVHHFPADRSGIMQFRDIVVSSLLGDASQPGWRPSVPGPKLSGVRGDLLRGLAVIDDAEGPLSDHGKAMETEILGGEIRMERVMGITLPQFYYRPTGWGGSDKGIPLANASAMVSELAPIVLWLRHVAKKGDLLIIEEPEAHLHPALQAKLAIRLARLVKAGVRVIVTTHSAWMVEQFTNLICLSLVSKARRAGVETYLRKIAQADLDRSMMGVWLFEPRRRPAGSVAREVPFDLESGLIPLMQFTDVSLDIYNEWAMIENQRQSAAPA